MIQEIYEVFKKSTGVSTDTRSILPNQLFFALKGPNFDGSIYVETALEKGAIAVVTYGNAEFYSDKIFKVNDSLRTLQELANFHRKQLQIPIIALTGSNGKTTTKELVSLVLKQNYHTLSTEGNLNNHIGVPLTLLKITQEHEIAVLEMGANKLGDIDELCRIAEPTHGLITSIGKAHLEGFGSLDGVKKGKSEMYRFLRETNGCIFLNESVEYLKELIPQNSTVIPFGTKETGVYVSKVLSTNPLKMTISLKGDEYCVHSHLFGSFHQNNILYAIQVGLYFNVPIESILNAISLYVPSNNRSEKRIWKNNIVLLDAYNANPTSMKSAIVEFVENTSGNKLLILGDMFELGDFAVAEHQAIVDYVSTTDSEVLVVGDIFYHTLTNSKNIQKFKSTEECKAYLCSADLKGFSMLVKGSRFMKLERIFD